MNILSKIYIYFSITVLVFAASYVTYRRKFKQKKHSYSFDLKDQKNIVPLVIIGSGPAGYSAGIYGARARTFTVIFQGQKPGGQLTGTSMVENWPGIAKMMGADMMKMVENHAKQFGAAINSDTIIDADFSVWPFKLTTENGNTIAALSVVLATGANPKKLGIKGEDEYWGKGVTTCAICDAPYFQDKNVYVIGGGDSAVEEAIQLAPYAKQITILVRGDKMRAAPSMQEKLFEYPNIKVHYNTQIAEIFGNADASGNEHVNGVFLKDSLTGQISKESIDGVFLAIGHKPNTDVFKKYLKVDENGYLILKPGTQETSIKGIYAAGDVSDNKYRQAGVASGDGIKAALDALSFLRDIGFSEKINAQIESQYFVPELSTETMEIPNITSEEQFEKDVIQSKVPVIVDFYQTYCPSCMQMLPALESLAATYKDKLKIVKVDTQKLYEYSKKIGVKKVPHILVYKNGKVIKSIDQALSKRQLVDLATEVI